jgi:hypothetical protein
MKKMKITKLSVIGISLLSLVACGETATETAPTEKTCKTINDVTIDCADSDALSQLEKLASDIESMSNLTPEDTKLAAEKNMEILKSIDPLMPNLEKAIAADAKLMEEFFVTKIYDAKKDVENYTLAQEDMKLLQISASWNKNDVLVTFKNTSAKSIKKLNGIMIYKDAAGTILAEDNVDFHTFHFTPESADAFAPGYEGTSDRGINVDKEKRSSIATVELVIHTITYAE